MSQLENRELLTLNQPDPMPLSLLNDFLYCQRRAALKAIEGWRGENEFTIEGTHAHEQVDLPGFENRAGWTLLRALPLWCERLGLSGKADLVEAQSARSSASSGKSATGPRSSGTSNSEESKLSSSSITALRPVEYKRGRKSRWENDHVQLCAQALCLEEMFDMPVPEGLIFHAASHQRTTVLFDDALRAATEQAVASLRAVLASGRVPPAFLKPQCDGCSLREICLPELGGASTKLDSLFAT